MQSHRRVRPHPDQRPSPIMDIGAYLFGVLAPLFTIPQIIDIWMRGGGSGVSLITWGAYLVCSCFWFYYALYHRDRPLMLTHGLWVLMQATVVVGIILYL